MRVAEEDHEGSLHRDNPTEDRGDMAMVMVMGASHVPMEMSLSRLRVAESASKSQNRRIPVRNQLLSDTAACQLEKNAT